MLKPQQGLERTKGSLIGAHWCSRDLSRGCPLGRRFSSVFMGANSSKGKLIIDFLAISHRCVQKKEEGRKENPLAYRKDKRLHSPARAGERTEGFHFKVDPFGLPLFAYAYRVVLVPRSEAMIMMRSEAINDDESS